MKTIPKNPAMSIEDIVTRRSSFILENDENNVTAITHMMDRFVVRNVQERGLYNLYFERYNLDGSARISSEKIYSSLDPIEHIRINQDASDYDDGLFVTYAVKKSDNNYDIIGNNIEIIFDPKEDSMLKFQSQPSITIFESQPHKEYIHVLSDDTLVIGMKHDDGFLRFKSVRIHWNLFILPPKTKVSDEMSVAISSPEVQLTVAPFWSQGEEYPDKNISLINVYELKPEGIYCRRYEYVASNNTITPSDGSLYIAESGIKQFKVISDASVAIVREAENKQELRIKLSHDTLSDGLLVAELDDLINPLRINFISDHFVKGDYVKERRLIAYSIGDKQYTQVFSDKDESMDLQLVGSPLESESEMTGIIHVQNVNFARGRNVVIDNPQFSRDVYNDFNVTYYYDPHYNPHHSATIMEVGNDPYTVTTDDQLNNVIFRYSDDQILMGHLDFKLIPDRTHSTTTSPTVSKQPSETPSPTASDKPKTPSRTPISNTPSSTARNVSPSHPIYVPSQTPVSTRSASATAIASRVTPDGGSNSNHQELIAAALAAAFLFTTICYCVNRMKGLSGRVFATLHEDVMPQNKARDGSSGELKRDDIEQACSNPKAALRQNVDISTTGIELSDAVPNTSAARPKITTRNNCNIL